MKNRLVQFLLVLSVVMPVGAIAGNPSDYLILQDIGPYKLSKPEEIIPGFLPVGGPRTYDGAAIVSGADHFRDHIDTTYEVMYSGGVGKAAPTVKVTQHAGGEADRWLLHELDKDFRNYGVLRKSIYIRQVDGNNIFCGGVGGWHYRWTSGMITVSIENSDAQMTKPEPLEIVKAYLAKYPSTMQPVDLNVYRNEQTKIWIKDELERRLWLADRWASLMQPGDAELIDKLWKMVDSMEVFLKFRAKYFGIEAKDEIVSLKTLAEQNNAIDLRAKLAEYKEWWAAHRSESICLTRD